MHFREGTEDEKIFRLAAKEYGELDFEGKTVLDIGAHVGGFSFHAASSGAARVVAFEAGSDNFALLQRNCAAPNIECRHAAVWNVAGELTWGPGGFGGNPVVNTGGGGMMAPGDEKVTAVAFDDVVRELGRVDILKIDAEGSEYPILMTSKRLGQVERIVGEYHPVRHPSQPVVSSPHAHVDAKHWKPRKLFQSLARAGFEVRLHTPLLRLGLFSATRSVVA
jgi:FkbM family methyltransferase